MLEDIPSREEMLLRKIQAQLQTYTPPQHASEYITQIATEELATIMAWAELGLRQHVVKQRCALQEARLKP